MAVKPASDLLYDSEATLRAVDSALDSLRETEGADPALRTALQSVGVSSDAQTDPLQHMFQPLTGGPMGLLGLSQVLARGYAEIVSVLGSLRESRSLLEKTAVDRLHHTHAKLKEVSTATETAATSILDGLERCLGMVDSLEGSSASDPASAGTHAQLRDELFTMMNHMQFQDITTQQINYASNVLTDMEARLAQLASVLDPAAFGVRTASFAAPAAPAGPQSFDPAASTQNAEQRQAVADDVFENRVTRL